MKKIFVLLISLITVIACNSTNYEIIEEEGELSDPIIMNIPESPDKTLYSLDEKSSVKESFTTSYDVHQEFYEIQIGAFGDKTNADNFYKNSRQMLGNVNYRVSDNLTRITYGYFLNLSEAEHNLQIIKNKGFKDAFIRKLSR